MALAYGEALIAGIIDSYTTETQGQASTVRFNVATVLGEGENQITALVPCVARNDLATLFNKQHRNGDRVFVQGEIVSRVWYEGEAKRSDIEINALLIKSLSSETEFTLNYARASGNMCADPELRQTQSGRAVCSVSVAVNYGTTQNRLTAFVPCVFWGKTAEFVARYFHKGAPIFVGGTLQSRTWETQSGALRKTTELTSYMAKFVVGKADAANEAYNSYGGGNLNAMPSYSDNGNYEELGGEEELPF